MIVYFYTKSTGYNTEKNKFDGSYKNIWFLGSDGRYIPDGRYCYKTVHNKAMEKMKKLKGATGFIIFSGNFRNRGTPIHKYFINDLEILIDWTRRIKWIVFL